jgi:hypothetical protein
MMRIPDSLERSFFHRSRGLNVDSVDGMASHGVNGVNGGVPASVLRDLLENDVILSSTLPFSHAAWSKARAERRRRGGI